MVSPKYTMISKINDALEPRFKAVLSLFIVGEIISSGSLFDKHRAKLLQRYKDEKNAKVGIAHAIKRACDLGILKRCCGIPKLVRLLFHMIFFSCLLINNCASFLWHLSYKRFGWSFKIVPVK